jgi:colanic acid/amylovoran biosynthesis glycosyltransferase
MSSPLRIAFFVGTFPVVSETFIVRQIAGLLDLGHDARIFADSRADASTAVPEAVRRHDLLARTTFVDAPPETAPYELPVWPLTGRTWPPGAEHSVPNWRRLLCAVPKFVRAFRHSPRLACRVLKSSEYGFQAASLSALHRLARLCGGAGRFDVLHAHFGPVGNSFRFARELWRAPLVVSFHGHDFSTVPRKQGRDVYRRLFATADLVTVNSEHTRRAVEGLGCRPDRIRKLPVGLDLAEFVFKERQRQVGEPVRIFTAARLVDIKGHPFVLRALATLRARHPEIRYDIVGDGPLRKELLALVAELGLQGAVTLHGALDGAMVRHLMQEAHLAVLASVQIEGDAEGQGLFLQEAQACGLPVVATQHGALPEGLLPDQSGFLVPERNVEALAGRLEFLVQHPERWPDMGRRGRTFVEERFDIRKLNRQLVEIYAEAVQAYRARR